MMTIVQDIRHALRTVVRSPGYALITVLLLALGIGANVAIFSAVNAVLLRPLPVRDESRLVMLWEENAEKNWYKETAAPANMLDWREQVEAFEDVSAYSDFGSATLTGVGEPAVLEATGVTGNFFSVLGVRAAHGRVFRDEETWSDAARVVVLSDAFWRSRFGADPAVIGTTIRLDGSRTRWWV